MARFVDTEVRRLLNDPKPRFSDFYRRLSERGITVWGAAVDTLENTSRFAEGKSTGPMAVFHLFDSPLRVSKPYESYMGSLTVPRQVAESAERASILLDYRTPRGQVAAAVEASYPGLKRSNIHVWTLRGKSRVGRLGNLWAEWQAAGVHLVEDGWKTPAGVEVFTDSGTYAPTFLVGSWKDQAGETAYLKAGANGHAAVLRRLEPHADEDERDLGRAFLAAHGASHGPEYQYEPGRLKKAAVELAARAADFVGDEDPLQRLERLRRATRKK